jgi:hypothetical protein
MSIDHDIYDKGGVEWTIVEGGWGCRLGVWNKTVPENVGLRYSDELLTIENLDEIIDKLVSLRDRLKSYEA